VNLGVLGCIFRGKNKGKKECKNRAKNTPKIGEKYEELISEKAL
jgi:hypothetical protein